jgi:hypothetical protein
VTPVARRTARPARVEHREGMHGAIAEMVVVRLARRRRAAGRGRRVALGRDLGELAARAVAAPGRRRADCPVRRAAFLSGFDRAARARGLSRPPRPTFGTWQVGDKVERLSAAAGGNVGWVAATAGSPGSWKKTYWAVAS